MKRNSFIAALSIAAVATLSVGFVNVSPRVIYGKDDRVDVYQVESAAVREVADSTVALIASRKLKNEGNGFFKIQSPKFGPSMSMCIDEPFYDQPVAASCSGSLVGEDLIATAGHCVGKSDCSMYSIVFGYKMSSPLTAPEYVSENDVYACKEIVAREYTSAQDYALLRLDRPVLGHRPLSLQKAPVAPHDEVYVVGHPTGLPTKVAAGSQVRRQRGAYFTTNLDTFAGNSGSAVFNASTHEVVGILVRGEEDFVYDKVRQCSVSNRCENDKCRGEDVTNIFYIRDILDVPGKFTKAR